MQQDHDFEAIARRLIREMSIGDLLETWEEVMPAQMREQLLGEFKERGYRIKSLTAPPSAGESPRLYPNMPRTAPGGATELEQAERAIRQGAIAGTSQAMDEPHDPTLQHLWEFVRGDVPASDFEPWVYRNPILENQLGDELYLETTSTDFSDKDQTESVREALARHVRSRPGPSCLCVRLRNVEVVDMGTYHAPEPAFEDDREWSGDDVFDSLDRVKDRGGRYWWLYAARCRECTQGWLVGCEARINDVMCMRRLDDAELDAILKDDLWPAEFESFECLLKMGHDAGRSVRWFDPMDSDLGITIAEIAKGRPGIAVSKIATLLGIDFKLAKKLAHQAVRQSRAEITFDSP